MFKGKSGCPLWCPFSFAFAAGLTYLVAAFIIVPLIFPHIGIPAMWPAVLMFVSVLLIGFVLAFLYDLICCFCGKFKWCKWCGKCDSKCDKVSGEPGKSSQ